jgi:nucleotide-binding universal stress UspA family protein
MARAHIRKVVTDMSQTVTDGGTSQHAQEKAQEVAGQAREKAQEGAQRAREGLRGQIDERSTQAGERVSRQSEDIRSVAQSLREQGKEGPAKLAEQAADRAQRVGSWLERSDGDQIMDEVEDFARRNPWAVALGGLALGFAASRMLRASSSERYQSRGGDGSPRSERGALPMPEPDAPPSYEPPVATTPAVGAPLGGERLP